MRQPARGLQGLLQGLGTDPGNGRAGHGQAKAIAVKAMENKGFRIFQTEWVVAHVQPQAVDQKVTGGIGKKGFQVIQMEVVSPFFGRREAG